MASVPTQIIRIEQAPLKLLRILRKMYSNRENKRLSIFSISLALLLGASNISLVTYLVSTANHKSIPSFDIPVGPYTSYRLTATKNGYTLSYKANDPKNF